MKPRRKNRGARRLTRTPQVSRTPVIEECGILVEMPEKEHLGRTRLYIYDWMSARCSEMARAAGYRSGHMDNYRSQSLPKVNGALRELYLFDYEF